VTATIHGVNHLDLNRIDGVCFWKIQVFMAQSIQDADHVWLVMINRLFEKGLVSRVESTEDRRVQIVALTRAAGISLFQPSESIPDR
jgi:hypothetical protein